MTARRRNQVFDTAMDLLGPAFEPAAAPLRERSWLLYLGEAQELAEEGAGFILASRRDGELDVGDARDMAMGNIFPRSEIMRQW